MLIDVFSIGGFFRLVTTPTRGQNILDLFATNRPTLVERLSITFGLSDYKIIYVESSLSSVVVQPKPRKVYLWNRANFQNINEIMSDFSNSCHNIDTPIEELWNIFKTQCKTCLNSIPTKSLSSSIKHPKITTSIRRLSKCRLSHKSRYLRYFRDLRNGTIITEGKTRGDYVPFRRSLNSEDTVDLGDNQYRLWLVQLWSLPIMAAS